MNDTKFTKLNKPDFDRLYEMKSAMRNFLDEEADFKNTKWMEKLDEILEYPLPKADGYEGFWKNPPSIQHPLATMEIVSWDSSCVLLLSTNKEVVEKFKKAFPKCQDLSAYNSQ